MNSTDEYYENNAEIYFKSTAFLDFSETCEHFLRYVKPGGKIVDIGCGSGRDVRFFKSKGFRVCGIDACASLCRLARDYSGAEISCMRIEDWKPRERFDGLWACASLVHLPFEAIETFFGSLRHVLVKDGVAFFSFKSDFQGIDSKGRLFTKFSKTNLNHILNTHRELSLLEYWENSDAMGRGDVLWQSFILRYI